MWLLCQPGGIDLGTLLQYMWFLGQAEGIETATLLQAVCGSWVRLRALVNEVTDNWKKQYLTRHFTSASSEHLHSHHVKMIEKTWNASFQY